MLSCMEVILNYITLVRDEDLRNTNDSNTNMDIVEITPWTKLHYIIVHLIAQWNTITANHDRAIPIFIPDQ